MVRSLARGSILGPIVAGVVAFALAAAALLPGVSFWDTAEFQTVGPLLGTAHPTGYPTYVILGWLASVILQPLGDPALRMNLLSAICLGVAAALLAVLVNRLTSRTWLGLAAGVLLPATPIAWAIGTRADPHALHLVFVALLLVLLVDWERLRTRADSDRGSGAAADRRLVIAAAVYGVALGNHSLILLLAPGIALFVLAVEPRIVQRPRMLLACCAALLFAAVLVFLELPLRAGVFRAPLVYGHPETLFGFWYVVLGAQFTGSLVAPFASLGDKVAEVARVAAAQLGPLAGLVPFALLATAVRRPRYALLTAPAVVITCWFAVSYANAEIGRYYLGPELIALTWIGILADTVLHGLEWFAAASGSRLAGRRAEGEPAAEASVGQPVLGFLMAGLLLLPALPTLPGTYAVVDQSHDRDAATWLDAVLDPGVAPPDTVIVSWWSYSTPLWYAQLIQGRRPDISIIDDRTRLDRNLGEISDVIDANLGRRPILVIQVDPHILYSLSSRYRLVQQPTPGNQSVFRVDGVLAGVRP